MKEHMRNNSSNKFKEHLGKDKNFTYFIRKNIPIVSTTLKLINLKQMMVILFIWNHSY